MVPEQSTASKCSWGYEPDFADTYKVLGHLGKGGNGVVNRVQHKDTGQEFACKVLQKQLDGAHTSEQKRAAHRDSVRNEAILSTAENNWASTMQVSLIKDQPKGGLVT